MLKNNLWQKEIRRSAALKSVKFPKEQRDTSKTDPTKLENLLIYGDFSRATIRLSAFGVGENMQSNPAAFEAWALALLVHCQVAQVVIEVGPGVDRTSLHYNRFSFRLARFAEIYPGVVMVNDASLIRNPQLDDGVKLVLKAPVTDRDRPATERDSESELEVRLSKSPAFQKAFRLDLPPLRQLPVGVFADAVASGNEVFTGGASAIDLIGVRGDTLVLFELKWHKPKRSGKVGILSEAFFYASLMRDALLGRIELGRMEDASEGVVTRARIAGCTNIEVVLLADKFHPLIATSGLLESLNAAMARTWTDVPVTFKRWIVAGRPPVEADFLFVEPAGAVS